MICMSDHTPHKIGGDELPSIEVIARQLSFINRFNGAVGAYSVAQHCVLASWLIEDQTLALAALLHDAPEAIYGDIASPVKRHLQCAALEDHYHGLVDTKYGVETRHPLVNECDLRMLITEAKQFGLPLEFFPNAEPYDFPFWEWTPDVAEGVFLDAFHKLTGTTT
jgi:hypothetical protein